MLHTEPVACHAHRTWRRSNAAQAWAKRGRRVQQGSRVIAKAVCWSGGMPLAGSRSRTVSGNGRSRAQRAAFASVLWSNGMKTETLNASNEARRAGRAIVRATNLATGEDVLLEPGIDTSPLGDAAAGAARADTSGPAVIEGRNWFLSVFNPPLELVIVGAVHIAQPLVRMAQEAGYRVRIIDPRTAFATAARFPGVDISHDY